MEAPGTFSACEVIIYKAFKVRKLTPPSLVHGMSRTVSVGVNRRWEYNITRLLCKTSIYGHSFHFTDVETEVVWFLSMFSLNHTKPSCKYFFKAKQNNTCGHWSGKLQGAREQDSTVLKPFLWGRGGLGGGQTIFCTDFLWAGMIRVSVCSSVACAPVHLHLPCGV